MLVWCWSRVVRVVRNRAVLWVYWGRVVTRAVAVDRLRWEECRLVGRMRESRLVHNRVVRVGREARRAVRGE